MGRKAVLDSVGWFDERYFMYAEDADLSQTIRDQGWELFYVTEGEIMHVGGASSRKTPSAFPILMQCESMSKLMRKYYGRLGGWSYRLATLTGALAKLPVLAALALASLLGPAHRKTKVGGALDKNTLVFLWSIGLKKPLIPGPVPPAAFNKGVGKA